MITLGIALAVVGLVAVLCIPTRETLGEEERQLRDYFRRIDGEDVK